MIHARALPPAALLALSGGLAACAEPGGAAPAGAAVPEYLGIETRLLDSDLVQFHLALRGGGRAEIDDYARCAAAQYALIRGMGFARHIRTTASAEAGTWRGDAVYTISA
ncbi:MAG: hypothetical protein CVT80_14595, partial [Alphaproteobacteria bacterium HGW-Alphaproteobacteria-2]